MGWDGEEDPEMSMPLLLLFLWGGDEWEADNIKGLQKSSGKLTVVLSSRRQKHDNKNNFSHLYISLVKFCTFLQI